MDPKFRVQTLSRTNNPQQVIYAAMHQDYSEGFVFDENMPPESRCGELVVSRLLRGDKGHYGPLEHPQIILNCGWFPHSTMQQIRTHRVGVSFDVQSFRYTGQRLIDASEDRISVEEVFYLRPVGTYSDRKGKKYEYTPEQRQQDIDWCHQACDRYRLKISLGVSEEHARGIIPFDVRQHWVMSANVRSLMHLLDLRWKPDAQLECQQLCDLIWAQFEIWVPAIAGWYAKNRSKKARLAP